jgi:hypothetical protein
VTLVSLPADGLRFRENERIAVCDLPEQIEGAGTPFEKPNSFLFAAGISSLKLRRAHCGCRYSSQRVPRRKVLDDF